MKNPADLQTFTVYPTNVSIPQLTVVETVVQRTLTAEFRFTASYPSGLQVLTGSAALRIAESDGTTIHTASAVYNSTLGSFAASYRIPLSGQTGIWVATVDPNTFDDNYGNTGPKTSVTRGFTVQKADLTVRASLGNKTYVEGDLIPIYAVITSPDSTAFGDGNVTAALSYSGNQIASPIALTYVQGERRWAGGYTVKNGDPSGVWLVDIRATDSYGNFGRVIVSSAVSVSPPTQSEPYSVVNLIYFALLAVIIGVAAVAVLPYARRRIVKKEIQVNLSAIDKEAQKVQETEFFKNIKKQVMDGKKQDRTE